MGGEVLVYAEPQVRAALDIPSLIEAVERAFVAYSTGRAELPSVIHLSVPEADGEIHVKAGHLHGASHYAVKVSSGFYGREPAAIDGLVLVFDATDGALAALLLDNGYVTDARTGAAGGVAARHLAPERVERVAVIGTGVQARYQLDALACVRSFERVRVWGRSPDRAERCVSDLRECPGLPAGATYDAASTVREAVRDADVVITCTASREPLVEAGWLSPGAHVTALGSDAADKRELDVGVLAAADVLVVDSRSQCARIGELHHALEAGIISKADDVAELGEVVAGRRPGRTSDRQMTVCDLTGVGVQDVVAAALVLERAGKPVARLRR
jgi:ornithine cyclodeaminase